jgi:2-polyprenyl-3-methyl-5-hydroxy-6-metoxy-1,4-benzoquinol methylase
MTQYKNESELRFSFGKNWKRYLKGIGFAEIEGAKRSLAVAIEGLDLANSSFLDIGSGSGLFSRAAYELGFLQVISFDYDQDSVDATSFLQKQSGSSENEWRVISGSVLDEDFMKDLGMHDVVYSWGVLHHTGDMWKALDLASTRVKHGGKFYIALYNDQGWVSRYWYLVKRFYVGSSHVVRLFMLLVFWAYFGFGLFVADFLRGRNPFKRHTGDARGMKFFTDVIDWVGGFPFEVASTSSVVSYMRLRGFEPIWQKSVGKRHGCNEFVFQRASI